MLKLFTPRKIKIKKAYVCNNHAAYSQRLSTRYLSWVELDMTLGEINIAERDVEWYSTKFNLEWYLT